MRGTSADEDGNITMEHEAVFGEMISMAQAARRAGGIVIAQVKRMALRGTLPPKQVKIPGMLVDLIVVDPGQTQTFFTAHDPAYAGEIKVPLGNIAALPFSVRKIVARRAALELYQRRHLQSRLRDIDRNCLAGRRGECDRRRRADQRAGPYRRRAGDRQ